MPRFCQWAGAVPAFMATALLVACGGGGSSTGSGSPAASQITTVSTPQDPGAPQSVDNTATDGFNWFNYRRKQLNLPVLARTATIDRASQSHSDYQKLNNTITHTETPGNPGFTGETLFDRLTSAGYRFGSSYAYGEVISRSNSASGVTAAEDLITAIYHRFVIFEPMFKEAGAGAATDSDGNTYFTTDFAANGLDGGIGQGKFAVYPFAGENNVPVNFFSDYETPDPVPDKNEVGYPISVHADLDSTVSVVTFTVQPHGGAALPVRQLTHDVDDHTSSSVAAIIPLSPLAHATTYDVQFVGAVGGIAASRSWSFTTQ